MTGPSYFQVSGSLGGASLIGTNCIFPQLGDKLKDDASCCAPTCGCWCIAVIAYKRVVRFGSTANCTDCVGKSVFNIDTGGTLSGPCLDAPDGGYGVGDTFTTQPINAKGGSSSCSNDPSIPNVVFTLGNTGGWVLYFSDSVWDVYANIVFQNSGNPCNGTPCVNLATGGMPNAGSTPADCLDDGPCLTNVDVEHRHSTIKGWLCFPDNTVVCDPVTGLPCLDLDCRNHGNGDAFTCTDLTTVCDSTTGSPCTGGNAPCGQYDPGFDVVCPNITETPFTPDFVPRNDT